MASRQTDRQIKKLNLCKLQRKHLSKGQTSSRDGWYHMHHFCQWALRFEFTYFSIISEVIPATTSHITTCLKLTSVWDKNGVMCALSKKFFKHSLDIIIFSISSSKMQKNFQWNMSKFIFLWNNSMHKVCKALNFIGKSNFGNSQQLPKTFHPEVRVYRGWLRAII